MNRWSRIADIIRLDMAAVRRSRWLTFMCVVYALLMGIFLFVGFRESSILEFTGLGRVLLNFSHTVILFLPLLALFATVQIIPQARDDGSLEVLMSHPFHRSDYFVGKAVTRFAALSLPLVLLAGVVVAGPAVMGVRIPWGYVGNLLASSLTLLFAFTGIGLLISASVASTERALIGALVAWAAGVALLDFGLIAVLLQWRIEPASVFLLAVLNPVECARLLLLASAKPELGILGPVGFFIVNKFGTTALRVVALGWPTLLGAGTLWAGWRQFKTSDLV
jgi:ABC-type transport system involved in multi-copper enzyme maturation permease subunit